MLTAMARPGRNDRCPCGSGKKYKACCLTKDEAAEREVLDAAQSGRDARAAEKHQSLREARKAMIAKLSGAEEAYDDTDDLADASNAVLDLIRTGRLDEAEAAARKLVEQYPDTHDGYDRLGHVYEARCENRLAADCYRRVIAFLQQNPDYAEPGFQDMFIERIAKLDPPAAR